VAACVLLVGDGFVDLVDDAVHVGVDRHADGGWAVVDQVLLDFGGGVEPGVGASGRGHFVREAAGALAGVRAAAVAERVGAAAVAVRRAEVGAEAVLRDLLQRGVDVAAVAVAVGRGARAPDEFLLGEVGVLVAGAAAVDFGLHDGERVGDCVRHSETPAGAALSLVLHGFDASVVRLTQIKEVRQARTSRFIRKLLFFDVFFLT